MHPPRQHVRHLVVRATVGDANDLQRLARGNVGIALYKLQRYDEAAAFQRVISEADAMALGKIAADSRFNRALMILEQGRTGDAESDLQDARRRYVVLGDAPSVADVHRYLQRIRST